MEIEENKELIGDGPTVRRGKKVNPVIAELQNKENRIKDIKNHKDYKDSHIAEGNDLLEDEVTQKEDHQTYERKKGGMKEIKEYF